MTRVLVIDDEPQIPRAWKINLSVPGYDVSTAATEHRPNADMHIGLFGLDGDVPDSAWPA